MGHSSRSHRFEWLAFKSAVHVLYSTILSPYWPTDFSAAASEWRAIRLSAFQLHPHAGPIVARLRNRSRKAYFAASVRNITLE